MRKNCKKCFLFCIFFTIRKKAWFFSAMGTGKNETAALNFHEKSCSHLKKGRVGIKGEFFFSLKDLDEWHCCIASAYMSLISPLTLVFIFCPFFYVVVSLFFFFFLKIRRNMNMQCRRNMQYITGKKKLVYSKIV